MALTQLQYDSLMRMYEQRKFHTRDIMEARKKEVYTRIPRVKELENTISELSLKQARRMLDGDTTALSALKTDLHKLSQEKARLIAEAGFPSDYLEPVYICEDCKDTGYIDNHKCHCYTKAVIDMLYTQSNLKEILAEENFDTFSLNYYSVNHVDPKTGRNSLENIKNAVDVCHEFIATFGSEFHNLFLYGDTGVGKTFLSHCIAKELIDTSFSVIYFTAFELFDMIAKSRFKKEQSADEMYDHIFDCDLLIIDDLGTEMVNTFTSSELFQCINERILRRKSTIISTNLSLESIVELYSERTFSRITSNYTMLKLTGDDIRIKKKLMG